MADEISPNTGDPISGETPKRWIANHRENVHFKLGGKISIDSEIESGTTVEINIPFGGRSTK